MTISVDYQSETYQVVEWLKYARPYQLLSVTWEQV